MKEWIAVLRAADTAARWHVHQRRKGIAQEPYVNHLLEVANLVTEATGGTDPTLVIAALLHDAIEDQGVASKTIASAFGKHVADIVMEVTDDKTLPKDEAVRTALKRASGLLPFLAWIAADDHNDDTNLVVEELENDDCRVMATASRHPIHPRPSGHFASRACRPRRRSPGPTSRRCWNSPDARTR
jgi:hypothetical protein